MSLTIKENNNVFTVEGSINANTAQNFQSHFEMLLNAFGELTIDIENVSEIDANGLEAIRVLHDNALNYNRGFFILGNTYKDIYDELRYTEVAV
ncbi:STAS domain-containing protein [Winogradskyella sp. UBA3174]|uniref:STAS domain-containing protein n=1 Tax=Winogradskyella sp. UBA3174 TaxID=1947785 RepID=UPI0025E19899|nr:STAS domain-containing protein [Winogradskyella sp. UBA3174]|tara:strand:- start:80060 stop:80341 length:282 start_codon:yes stop_codon:yes gene_type:complete